MLKETIRQLVSGTGNVSMAMGGQLQIAGVSAAEQKALLGELKEKNEKNSGYAYMWS
ncbi:competence pheromone ComX [Paenibacillus sp. LPE1-1-1.1]|uniref:competence pheromone ComX n=1 Tax=Paenibacillus sp. LPE1-1-1.1 TaxID=3135230 RepID=UPI0034145583